MDSEIWYSQVNSSEPPYTVLFKAIDFINRRRERIGPLNAKSRETSLLELPELYGLFRDHERL